jgi:phage tail-like protein
MANGEKVDPYRSFNFVVEISGVQQAGFTECSGFDANHDVTEYREGDEPMTVRKVPGLTKYSNITLKWGLTDSHELYDWFREVSTGTVKRKNGSIVINDFQGAEKVRWNFTRGLPVKYDPSNLNAKTSELAIETFEIAVEGIEKG